MKSRRFRFAARLAGFIFIGLLLVIAVGSVVSADVRFVLRAGYEEGRLLLRRRPIEKLVADPRTSAVRRGLFRVVLDARTYGADSLGLAVKETYTTFVDVGRDTLVLVLTASPRNQLREYTWWFPVVGSVPYHGYFTLTAARREMSRMEAQGFDTYLRPAGAFSTLGWFSDPLFSTALTRDSSRLVETVLHEVTHNTVWVPGSAAFNESLAMFVGYRGAERFFRSRGDSALADRTAAAWGDEKLLGDFYARLGAALDSVYRKGGDEAIVAGGRAVEFYKARALLNGSLRKALRTYPVDWLLQQPLNNASVIAARVYRDRLDVFDRVLDAQQGDVKQAVRVIVAALKAPGVKDPYGVMDSLARVTR